MKYELRILSGLHRGAAMPLDEEALLMGASDHADIVLVDPGIEAKHAKISRTESGWVVSAEGGDLYTPDSAEPRELVDIEPGDFARVGQVWITVAEEDDPWAAPPPDPLPTPVNEVDPEDPAEASPIEEEEEQTALAQADVANTEEATETALSQSGSEGGESSDEAKANAEQSDSGNMKLRRMLIAPLAVLAVLSGAGAYALTAKSSGGHKMFDRLNIQADLKILNPDFSAQSEQSAQTDAEADKATADKATTDKATTDKATTDKATADKATADKATADKTSPQGGNKLTSEQLRQAFRKRLSDSDLLKRFELALSDESWSMRADLDEGETARFERVLKGFMDEHKITFPIHAKVVPAIDMLPFRVIQVISGNQASIVTDDGTRLYVGDEYRGVRVTAIYGNKLAFAGKRKIEVNW